MADQRPPSFFHILMNPSSPHLPLPLKFSTKHLRNEILKNPILKSANGGYLWKLKMKKFDDHTFCFVNGWCNVVEDLGLLFGEFLLFKYVVSGVFLMHVYSVNGCEKILVPRIINNFKVVDDDEVSVFEDEDEVVFDNDDDVEDDDDNDDDVEYDVENDDEDVAEEDEQEDDDEVELGDDEDEDDVEDDDDKFVFKHITSEDKISIAKISKKITPPTEVDDNDLKVDDGMDVVVDDDNVERVDDGLDGKNVVVDDNKDEDENVEPVDDGMDVVVDDNKDEDENVELVDDGMDGKDVVVDDNKDGDEIVKPVDGMDGKDVVVDDNKDEDENVKRVDDGMDGKDVVVDDNKDEDENVELVDNDMDVDAYDNKNEDKDVEFVVTITSSHKSKLRLPIDFVASAGIESKENITMKSLDGNESQMSIRTDKLRHRQHSKQYHLSVGWPAFKRSNSISEGDKCVFMYTTSDDKICLAKITKKENVGVDDDTDEYGYVEVVDDGMDVNEDAELVDDEGPFFQVTITPSHKSMLRLPTDFVGLAGINTKKNVIIKSLDGNESQMAVRSDKRFNPLQYHLAMGWVAFMQSNNLALGDECVFKYITSEDKLCLATITKTSTTEADADPFFVVTITPSHRSCLWLPIDFAGLAAIDTKENIIVKSLDGNEMQIALRSYPFKKKKRYCFSMGWRDFKRSNNISKGDECVFKYITSEDKMCLAKVNKKKTRTSLPSPAKVVKRKRDRLPPGAKIKMTAAESVKTRSWQPPPVEITVAEAVKRKRGLPLPSSPQVTKDVKRKKGSRKE